LRKKEFVSATTEKALALLISAEARVAADRALIGFDGFVDQIIRVVDKKLADGTSAFIPQIPNWADRIKAAAGKSTKFELSVQQVKLGGNAAIMANAMAHLGVPLTCLGNFGYPDLHPVFQPMKNVCDVITVADACYTDAVEFEDGKIMLSRQEAAALFTWDVLEKGVGKDRLFKIFDEARFVALDNWTAFPHMGEVWKSLQREVCPRLSKKQNGRKVFFDLSDPEYRLPEHIRECMELISEFQTWFGATLGLNQKEAGEICDVLGLKVTGNDKEFVQRAAETIRSKLKIEGVVIHAVAFAAAANANGSALVDGPYITKPLISTGAGDHFNAGYGLGTILGGDLEQCLQLGVATSGYYVRTAKSPSIADLRSFLKELA
jgi:sugar/nucleoside kinase (ribokinase family)